MSRPTSRVVCVELDLKELAGASPDELRDVNHQAIARLDHPDPVEIAKVYWTMYRAGKPVNYWIPGSPLPADVHAVCCIAYLPEGRQPRADESPTEPALALSPAY